MWELFAAYAWFLVFFSSHLEAKGHEAGANAAYMTFAFFAMSGVGCWVGGVVPDKWGRTGTTAMSMTISGACTILIGALFNSPTWVVVVVSLVWGFAIVADSAQFSTMLTELASQAYVGTALTVQLAVGFMITVATIWLIPMVEEAFGWRWAFAFLAPGPALGVIAMLRLKSSPEAARIAGGLG